MDEQAGEEISQAADRVDNGLLHQALCDMVGQLPAIPKAGSSVQIPGRLHGWTDSGKVEHHRTKGKARGSQCLSFLAAQTKPKAHQAMVG